jgi:hypothetical protein
VAAGSFPVEAREDGPVWVIGARERLEIRHKIQVHVNDRIFLPGSCPASSLSRPENENAVEQINVRQRKISCV